jgi:hypothetical protein
LLAAAVALMGAVIGNADPMEPFHRVGVGVPDSVWAHSFHEVVSIRTDHSHPGVHVMIRRVMPGTVIARTPLGRMDRDSVMAHVQTFRTRAPRSSRWELPAVSMVVFIGT